jgi:uncharacterized protein (TIGR00299 family) protein
VKTLWVDAGNGAAGDMLLAALLDAGADAAAVRVGLARLPVERVDVALSEVRRHGFRAARVEVTAPESPVHRGLGEVTGVIRAAGLPTPVVAFAEAAFARLADAEARVHGTSVDEVHFHEVGALDAIADVVGCALALHDLDMLDPVGSRVVSPVAVGAGTVQAAHGRLPVPAPAVAELLARAGAPLAAHPAQRELCTPTGAALLTTLATDWGPPPAGTLRAVGVGAGRADPPGHPNLLRVLIGEGSGDGVPEGWREESLWQVETTVDDLDPRIWPDLLERLRTAGAADAWCTPALMRKGRPGQVLTVLVAPEQLDLICRIVFTDTTTLGVRLQPVRRRALRRDQIEVTLPTGTVRVKRGFLDGELLTVQPEYDDARALAERTGTPVAEVLTAARTAASNPFGRS